MKPTDFFKQAIQKYLDNRASTDELFAGRYRNEKKNIDACCAYILSEVERSGRNGFADEEVYAMAVHYYDEDEIKPVSPSKNMRVVVNHAAELTDDEKKDAKETAIAEYQKKVIADMQEKKKKSSGKKHSGTVEQPSLF